MKILNKRIQMAAMANLYYKTYSCHKNKLTTYVKNIMALKKLLCYKCEEEIKIGDSYKRNNCGDRYTKYYHSSCYERLFH